MGICLTCPLVLASPGDGGVSGDPPDDTNMPNRSDARVYFQTLDPTHRRRVVLALQFFSGAQNARIRRSRERARVSRVLAAQLQVEFQSLMTAAALSQQQQRLNLVRWHLSQAGEGGRTLIPRVHWRNSTIFLYMTGTPIVFRRNFRCTRRTFRVLMDLIRHELTTEYDAVDSRWASQKAAQLRRHPSPEFRACTCLYILAHGGRVKPVADAVGQGESTVIGWMEAFFRAVIDRVRPIYMSGEPPSPELVRSIRTGFASRRGIGEVCMAVDGSHVPYNPRDAANALDYKNYKGWTSILAVAFVNSQHLFVDVNVGATGRAGDNTVLRSWDFVSRLQSNRDVWLGPGGVVAGDGGASDAGNVFLNPYFQPSTARENWFNFCHSSTRFFVEEVFGRWKNRWRCLMRPMDLDHRLTSLAIYVTAILHNLLTVEHRREGIDGDEPSAFTGTDEAWSLFFDTYQPERCPSCTRRNGRHCVHMAHFRNAGVGDDSAYEERRWQAARRAPSELREVIADRLLQYMDEEWGGDEFAHDDATPDDGRPGCSSRP